MQALEQRGREAGIDFGIVGCDNIQRMMRMPGFLTTIDAGCEEFAETGAEVMLRLLSGEEEELPSFSTTHSPVLVQGRSTKQR